MKGRELEEKLHILRSLRKISSTGKKMTIGESPLYSPQNHSHYPRMPFTSLAQSHNVHRVTFPRSQYLKHTSGSAMSRSSA